MDLVLDAVDTGHQHCRERQVGVGGRVRETDLDALALGVRLVGNPDGRGAVARRVGQHHRCLEARHQALVTVRRRVGEGVDGARVLDDAADVVQRLVRQTRIAVAREHVFAVLADRLVHVHAGAVVADQGLGHEGGGLAKGMRDVENAVLEDLYLVGLAHQRVELDADLTLSGGADFVMVDLHRQTHLLHGRAHGRADVMQGVDRGHREVAALHPRTVADVALVKLVAGDPGCLFGVDGVARAVHLGVPLDVVEHEELGLGTEVGGVADARRVQVVLCALRDGARVALVALHGGGLDDIAAQDNGGVVRERIEHRRAVVGHQDHV